MPQPLTIETTARDITPAPAQVEPKLPRLTDQQAMFFREFLRTGRAVDAYRMAYKVREGTEQRTVWANASRLKNHSKVALWIDWAHKQARTDDLNSILREFDQNREGALEDRNWSSANGATRGKAQALGLIPRNTDVGLVNGTVVNILIVHQDEAVF